MLTLGSTIVSAPAALREQLERVRGTIAFVHHLMPRCPGPITSTTASAKAALWTIARRWLAVHEEIETHGRDLRALVSAMASLADQRHKHREHDHAKPLLLIGDNSSRIGTQAKPTEERMACPTPNPTARPDIVVPDAGPLIRLAQAGALHLLHEVGRAVILVDIVADEVTRDPAKPGAQALARWIEDGRRPGSDAPVRVAETDTGRAVALARVADPAFSMRNGGESAIVGWLVETLQRTDTATIVVHENGRVPRVLAAQALGADIEVITTRTLLDLAERRGLIASAAETWQAAVLNSGEPGNGGDV